MGGTGMYGHGVYVHGVCVHGVCVHDMEGPSSHKNRDACVLIRTPHH
jgi:hypothetical protein